MSVGSFPLTRQRRMKKHAWLRELSAEHQLTNSDLILPLFVHDQKQSVEIPSLPGVYRYCLEDVIKVVEQASYAGIKAIMLFPVIIRKVTYKIWFYFLEGKLWTSYKRSFDEN